MSTCWLWCRRGCVIKSATQRSKRSIEIDSRAKLHSEATQPRHAVRTQPKFGGALASITGAARTRRATTGFGRRHGIDRAARRRGFGLEHLCALLAEDASENQRVGYHAA